MTDSAGRVADATGNWVDGLAPAFTRPYLRLARLDRPIGSWLLLMPCWWSSGLAGMRAGELPRLSHIILFFIGAFAMRGAGCTWNDLVDRDLDAKVERTRSRPIPSGQVSPRNAALFLIAQALIGLIVLLQFNRFTIVCGFASLGVVAIYPFMKRITYWPQLFLGLNFNWGALLGWAAVTGSLAWPPLLLYAGGICWTLGYDTIYAHQDKEDDARIGVKSSALALGERTRPFLFAFYAAAAALWAGAGVIVGLGPLFWIGLAGAAVQLGWQAARVDIDDPADCLVKFRSNRAVGWLLLAAIVAGHLA